MLYLQFLRVWLVNTNIIIVDFDALDSITWNFAIDELGNFHHLQLCHWRTRLFGRSTNEVPLTDLNLKAGIEATSLDSSQLPFSTLNVGSDVIFKEALGTQEQ